VPVTVKVTGVLVIGEIAAVIAVLPADTAVARPFVDITTTAVFELAQVTCEVMSVMLPSE
jgi:hypothetical protein